MTIRLYRYDGLPQVINKTLELETELETYQFTGEYDTMDPVIVVTGRDMERNFVEGFVNYIAVEDRYYYVQNFTISNNDVVKAELHLDVLMSYKDSIENMLVILERSSMDEIPTGLATPLPTRPYLTDDMYPTTTAETFEDIEFPYEFDDTESAGTYILLTSQTGYTPVN